MMHRGHSNARFDSYVITESSSLRKRKDRNIVQIGDDIAASWKEKEVVSQVKVVCMILVLNQMCFRYTSGSSEGEDNLSIPDPYLSGLFSLCFICAF